MTMALDAFRNLDLKVTIQYNNRRLLTGLLDVFGVQSEKINKVVLILDKLEKVGLEAVLSELNVQGLSNSTISLIKQFLSDEGNASFSYFKTISEQNEEVRQGLDELRELESYLELLGVKKQCVFNPFLARGLEIYTGTIYEIFLIDHTIKSSIGSGGRYDNAIGGLVGTDKKFPTVGISFGLDVIYTAMSTSQNKLKENPDVDYYIVPLDTQKESLMVANYLRNKGYKVEFEMGKKRLRKALDKANKEKIRSVIIIGEEEVKNNQYKVKDMFSGDERIESYQFV